MKIIIILFCFSARGKKHLFALIAFLFPLVNRGAFVCAYFLEPSRESEVRLVADAAWPSVTIPLSCVRILRLPLAPMPGYISFSTRARLRVPAKTNVDAYTPTTWPSIAPAVNNGENPPKFVAAKCKILKYRTCARSSEFSHEVIYFIDHRELFRVINLSY